MFGALMFVAAFVGVGVVGCLSAMAGQLYERRKWERRLLRTAGLDFDAEGPAAEPPLATDPRFDRLEQAVEAVALEMERVSEGQRFVTKLLADRRSSSSSPSPIPGR